MPNRDDFCNEGKLLFDEMEKAYRKHEELCRILRWNHKKVLSAGNQAEQAYILLTSHTKSCPKCPTMKHFHED